MNLSSIQTLTLSLIVAVGLIVLIAMSKVTWAEGGPALLLLAGVHVGANAVASGAQSVPTPPSTLTLVQPPAGGFQAGTATASGVSGGATGVE